MTSESAKRILARVETAWRHFRNAAEQLGLARWEETTPAGWSAKEMLAHAAFWEEAMYGWITIGIRQQQLPEAWSFGSGYYPEPDWPSASVHNAREAAWARSQTAAEVMARWDNAHEQLLAILASITDQEAHEHRDYFNEAGEHFNEHLGELQTLLSEPELSQRNLRGSTG